VKIKKFLRKCNDHQEKKGSHELSVNRGEKPKRKSRRVKKEEDSPRGARRGEKKGASNVIKSANRVRHNVSEGGRSNAPQGQREKDGRRIGIIKRLESSLRKQKKNQGLIKGVQWCKGREGRKMETARGWVAKVVWGKSGKTVGKGRNKKGSQDWTMYDRASDKRLTRHCKSL